MAIQPQEIIYFLGCKSCSRCSRGCDAAFAFLSFWRIGFTVAVKRNSPYIAVGLRLWLFAHPDQPQLANQKYARSINLHHSDCYASHNMYIFKLLLGSIIISCNITHVHKTNKNESNFFKWCFGTCVFPLYTTSTYAITAPSRIKWYAAPKYCNVALAISYPTI